MRIKSFILFTLTGAFGITNAYTAPITTGGGSVQPISQYGLIQNVQNYSSNPFWNPNGAYNQRMPQAVYATGPDVNTADCQRTVGTLIASYCVNVNNCVGMQLSDVRPAIMLQLARLPGHNYATACAGFVDSEFDDYVSKYSNAGPSNSYVAFPNATIPNMNAYDTEYQIENPYPVRNRTWNNEEWEREKKERAQELRELQAMNGANDIKLARADFPTTAADISFSDRMELKSAGYAPFKDASSYAEPFKIEDEDAFITRQNQINALNSYNNTSTTAQNPTTGNGANNTAGNSATNNGTNETLRACKSGAHDGIIHLCLG